MYIQQTLEEKIKLWPEWIRKYEFDPTYGYLIDPTYQPVSFDYDYLHSLLKDLHSLNESKKIIEVVKNMKEIQIKKEQGPKYKDMIILHDGCSYLVHSYVKACRQGGTQEADIVVPKNLANGLAFSASFLKVKIGMATGIGYNWFFKNKPQQLDKMDIKDIGLRSYYSQQPQHENLFFAVSVTTSYCLNQIIRNAYEINCIIVEQPYLQDEVRSRMKKINYFMQKIFQLNINIQLHLSRQFFYFTLRIFVAGFQNVTFEGIKQKISSSGGAGGYDPSFQVFQRAFGIKFDGQLGNIQQKLRNGMPQAHRKLIDFMAENSLIREYCECTPELQAMYNETIQYYVRYLELHGTFIKNFIIHFMPINTTRSSFGATGATAIKIVERFRFVRDQQL